tara:strand:+ start:74 stop:514 length:441 start_codon:yes stop_codon:yes gene_type:complete
MKSSMSLEELYASIDQGCEPWKFSVGLGGRSKPLFGKRKENEFKVYRAIRYQNSFLPVAFGKISENGNEVLVEITLKMNIIVMIFMTVWLSFALIGAVTITFSGAEASLLIPVGMVAFGYLPMQGGFWFEVPKLKKLVGNIVPEHS